MALDVSRALGKSDGAALAAFHMRAASILTHAEHSSALARPVTALRRALTALASLDYSTLPQAAARDLSLSLARTYIGALMVEQAAVSEHQGDALVAEDWCSSRELVPVVGRAERGEYSEHRTEGQRLLVYHMYDPEETFH